MTENSQILSGAGIGLRRSMTAELAESIPDELDFFELAPENWIGLGGKLGRQLSEISERIPIIAHGLSLSIGGPAPLDESLVNAIKAFIQQHGIALYSEHLSFSNDGGQLYDLLPMPFTDEAVRHVVERIKRVQDILGMKMSLENSSYYISPKIDFPEVEFVRAILEEADCEMLLDVNNVYVNSVNHQYDPLAYISALPADRISYLHIAGHYVEPDGLIVDTHGADVIDPVWDLLAETYKIIGVRPTLLERDFNIPAITDLLGEVAMIKDRQRHATLHAGAI